MHTRAVFTPEQDAYITQHYGQDRVGDIADHLGRSKRSVQHRALRLGVTKRIRRNWTPEEDEFIRSNLTAKLDWVAERLNRNSGVVSERAKRLGYSFRKRAIHRLNSEGYLTLRTSVSGERSTVWTHIETMEQHLGRKVLKPECVHHINGIKTDNRIDNLYLCRDSQHHRLVHTSLDRLLPDLLGRGLIEFDRGMGVYQLCKTHK